MKGPLAADHELLCKRQHSTQSTIVMGKRSGGTALTVATHSVTKGARMAQKRILLKV